LKICTDKGYSTATTFSSVTLKEQGKFFMGSNPPPIKGPNIFHTPMCTIMHRPA